MREIRWNRRQLRVPASSPLVALSVPAAVRAPAPPALLTIDVDLPDLSAFPRPIDKAGFLLHAAAEIEHALLVQYLYAAYSLKKPTAVDDAQQRTALRSWKPRLADIAKEEMGHLLTVQNLRLLIRQSVDLQREDFPQPPNVYPFTLQLQPLTQKSLAKYVVAESPTSAAGIEDIIQLATEEAGAMPNRVGVLYALLGVVFTKQGELATNAQGGDAWAELVRDIGQVAFQDDPDLSHWHLPDEAFDAASFMRQATGEDWAPGERVRVLIAADRKGALAALADVALQGEGPVQRPDEQGGSHFERFLSIYRGSSEAVLFPPAGDWQPSLDVPVNPKLSGPAGDASVISDAKARDFARLADLRYHLLLGFAEQYFLTPPARRGFLVQWSYEEMRSLSVLAGILTGLARGAGPASAVAALPFTLPGKLQLPSEPQEQWKIHLERLAESVALAQQMLQSHSAGLTELTRLVAQDQARIPIATAAQQGQLPEEPGSEWRMVRRILNAAAGFGSPRHQRFWQVPLATFITQEVDGVELIAPPGPNRGRDSNLVKALKGEDPFDAGNIGRMPRRRDPVAPALIALIEDWIDRGCPEG
jgi:ferritin-like protein